MAHRNVSLTNNTLDIMKQGIIFTAAIAVAMSLVACDEEDKKPIEFSDLPQSAQTFVQTHFADKQIAAVYRDSEVADKDYEVIFVDGANIDFTKKGEWDEVEDRDADGVPTAIMPQGIVDYVATTYAGQYVVQIGKDRSNYEVELVNGVDLVFDKEGRFLRYDD